MISFLKKHYHWIIAVVVLLQLASSGGSINNASSMFLLPVTESLGISRGDFSMAYSMRAIFAFLFTLITGFLLARFGYRKMIVTFLVITGLGFVLIGHSRNFLVLSTGFAMLGMSEGFGGTAGASRIIGAWFHRYRGTVLGLVTSATGLGGSLMCIVISGWIERFDWRFAAVGCGVLIIIVAAIMLLVIRNHPSQMGLKAFGEGELLQIKKKQTAENMWQGLTMQQLLRRPTFYMMLLGTFFSCMIIYFAQPVIVPHLRDCGLSEGQAATFQSVLMFCMAATKFLSGMLCDYIGPKKVTILCLTACAAAMLLLANITGMVTAVCAVILLAIALPLVSVTIPLLSADLFGYQSQGTSAGIFLAMMSGAMIVAVPVANKIFDVLNSYRPLYWCSASAMVLLIGMYLLMYALAERDRKKYSNSDPK